MAESFSPVIELGIKEVVEDTSSSTSTKRDHKFINISHINYQGGVVITVRKAFQTK